MEKMAWTKFIATFLRSVFKHQIDLVDAEVAAFERIDDRQQREHLHQDLVMNAPVFSQGAKYY